MLSLYMKEIYTYSHAKGSNIICVDDEDYDYLNQFSWFITNQGYASRNNSRFGGVKRIEIKMHREIMSVTDRWDLVDHRDHIRLNNQKYNLRVCTHQQNIFNKQCHKNGKSKYKGVHPYISIKKGRNKDGSDYIWTAWRASVMLDGIKYDCGLFKTEDEAALAYNEVAKTHYGEFAYLNKV